MTDKQALDTLKQIFDQCTGAGVFKDLQTALQVGRLYDFFAQRLQWPVVTDDPAGQKEIATEGAGPGDTHL